MKIAILSEDESYEEIAANLNNFDSVRIDSFSDLAEHKEIDGFFNLKEYAGIEDYSDISYPVFVNSVCQTLKENNHKANVVRINGWKGFLERSVWEVSGKLGEKQLEILKKMGKTAIMVPDEPGFISPRVVSMIVNEAYFAKEDGVSTEAEIDIAMKLGTNYPKGPFEWKNTIGIKNIHELLKTLFVTDSKYQPSPLLEKEAIDI